MGGISSPPSVFYPLFPCPVKSGRYVQQDTCYMGGSSTPSIANLINLFPFSRYCTINRIAMTMVVAGSAGTRARLGIYESNANTLLPAALLYQSGDIAIDSTGQKNFDLPANIIVTRTKWLAFILDTATGTIRSGINSNYHSTVEIGGVDLSDSSYPTALQTAQAYGALPADASGLANTPVALTHIIAARIA